MTANPNYSLDVSVLLDGPCNEWWTNFGPAPNNAYLIKPNGVIYKKHDWFDKSPNNITVEINSLISGLNENKFINPEVFPNPAESKATFRLPDLSEKATIRLVNVQGKEVPRFDNAGGSEFTIDTQELDKGIYSYQIPGNSGFYNGKLIIR